MFFLDGQKEKEIRKKLIKNNVIDTIIELPPNLFLNTSIPVIIMILNKNKENQDIFFINAGKLFEKKPKQNIMTTEHIESVISAYKLKRNIEKLSRIVSYEEIEKNDFNLNVPRYVSDFEDKEPINIIETTKELLEIEEEIKKTEKELAGMLKELKGVDNCGFEYEKSIEPLIEKWK